jgi:predicted RNA-binding Zn ribbon-like protein
VSFGFLAGRPALDFVATVAERGTTDLEELRTGSDLAAWIRQSKITDDQLTITTDRLAQTKTLREAMFRLLTALLDGTRTHPRDRALVNAAATQPRPTPQLSATGRVRRSGDLTAVLAVLAQDCIDLFDGPDRDALHSCADATCTRLFIDHSRGHSRRWCGMKGCGDRAKAAAYRRRQRHTPKVT